MRNKSIYIIPIIVIALVVIALTNGKKESNVFQRDSGFVFGTSYNVIYNSDDNLKDVIEEVLNKVDMSLSPFNEESVITAVNNNKETTLDSMFVEVFSLAREIHKETDGAFDITVAPLVNAWGFGFKSGKMPNETELDSIRSLVGFDKVALHNGKIIKENPKTMLDCSAIAKGYGVDQVAKALTERGIKNFMVEIGGEIVAKGHNTSGKFWNIGVTKPNDDSLSINQELQTILSITDIAMATSGNYRNFYYKNGKKYAHTIDPKTGYPVQHNILSATVLAESCAKADAYATSFMVLGLNGTQEILRKHKELKAYIIYTNDDGEYDIWMSPELSKIIKE